MIKPLTSLRFVFAFMVFLSHFVIDGASLFEGGHIGVSFFFMLSGFILTFSYKNKIETKSISRNEFWLARFARIYPLHIATLIASALVSFFIVKLGGTLSPISFLAFPFNLTLTQSFIPIEDIYFSFNAVSWSISDEAFFYFVFPFVILLLSRIKMVAKLNLFIVVIIGYSYLLITIPHNLGLSLFYINPLFRFIDFFIGILLYDVWHYSYSTTKFSSFIGDKFVMTFFEVLSILVFLIFTLYSNRVPEIYTYGIYFWVPMAFVILVFAQQSNIGLIAKMLSWKPLLILGEISFGFYMIHQLVIGVVMRGFNFIGIGDFPATIKFIIVLFITIILSILSFYFFETPMNRWIKSWRKNV